jgi:UPF0755 protein
MKRYLIAAVATVAAAASLAGFSLHRLFTTPHDDLHSGRLFVIVGGEPLSGVAQRLSESGLLRHPTLFVLAARVKGLDQRIKAGQYLLDSSMTPSEILQMLAQGSTAVQGITVPEGSTARQIGHLLQAEGITGEAALLEACRDRGLLRTMRIAANSAEGYLFPDTYYFYKGMGAEEVVRAMVRRFNEKVGPELRKKATAMGWTLHEVVTLASIVERETSRADERPLVASTFMNRLMLGMPLQSDPTVIYCIEGFSGDLTKQDLARPVPYNTYMFKGLPEGPICNPGLASIEAVVEPAETPYLYFVARNDGTHEFSSSLGSHTRAVSKYQKAKTTKTITTPPKTKKDLPARKRPRRH